MNNSQKMRRTLNLSVEMVRGLREALSDWRVKKGKLRFGAPTPIVDDVHPLPRRVCYYANKPIGDLSLKDVLTALDEIEFQIRDVQQKLMNIKGIR